LIQGGRTRRIAEEGADFSEIGDATYPESISGKIGKVVLG
jgi:hypothetical protein